MAQNISIINALREGIQHGTTPEGRTSRPSYWITLAFISLVTFLLLCPVIPLLPYLDEFETQITNQEQLHIMEIYFSGLFVWYIIAYTFVKILQVRRLRDTGKGATQVIIAISLFIISFIISFIILEIIDNELIVAFFALMLIVSNLAYHIFFTIQLCKPSTSGYQQPFRPSTHSHAQIRRFRAPEDWQGLELKFFQAAKEYNSVIIKRLLYQGVNINAQDENGRTALIYASLQGDIKMIRILLEQDCEVDLRDYQGKSAPMYASELKFHEIAKLLNYCSSETTINTPHISESQYTPKLTLQPSNHESTQYPEMEKAQDSEGSAIQTNLLAAANQRDPQPVNLLLEPSASVERQTNNGTTALLIAADNGHTDIVKLLLEQGAEVNVKTTDKGLTPLSVASQNGHTDIVKLLLEQGAEINTKTTDDGSTPLLLASQNGHTDIVKLLLAQEAELNSPSNQKK